MEAISSRAWKARTGTNNCQRTGETGMIKRQASGLQAEKHVLQINSNSALHNSTHIVRAVRRTFSQEQQLPATDM